MQVYTQKNQSSFWVDMPNDTPSEKTGFQLPEDIDCT